MLRTSISRAFASFASRSAGMAGNPVSFLIACATVLVWACFGPHFHWSDTHQLVINTGTTIVTFLMVFLIQNAQNREMKAVHAKLDILIERTPGPNDMIRAEERLTEEEIEAARPLPSRSSEGPHADDRVARPQFGSSDRAHRTPPDGPGHSQILRFRAPQRIGRSHIL